MADWRYCHGENSLTFSLFGEASKAVIARLLSDSKWSEDKKFPEKITGNQIKKIHLFPNFGKKFGYGEPDVIIVTTKMVIYIEVELVDLMKYKAPSSLKKQMGHFISLAKDLNTSTKKILSKEFRGESGYSFYGKRALRIIFKHIQNSGIKLVPWFLIISDGPTDVKNVNLKMIKEKVNIEETVGFGWTSIRKIAYMKNKPSSFYTTYKNIISG